MNLRGWIASCRNNNNDNNNNNNHDSNKKENCDFVMLFIASFNPFGRSKIQQSKENKIAIPFDLNSGAKRS
jgi:hypothetical protein